MKTEIDSTVNLIEEIETYVDNGKTVGMLSGGSMVKINREELLSMLAEVKSRFPKEVNESKRIVSTRESILADAKAKAEKIIQDAAAETRAMIDGDEVVAMANMRADEILADAQAQADAILMQARKIADELQNGALGYVQNMMAGLEFMYSDMIENEKNYFNSVMEKLKADHKKILENKHEVDLQLGNSYKSSRSKEDFEKKEDTPSNAE